MTPTPPAPPPPLLLATYLTLAGEVSPAGSTRASPVGLRRRIEAAGAAGYRGFGFGANDLRAATQSVSYREIADMLAANGITLSEIEVLLDWFCDGERRQRSDQARRLMLEAASALGARHIKVVGDFRGGQWPLPRLVECFAQLCDDAAAAGTAVAIELVPFSGIADLETGRAIVEGAGRANGGLLLDIWHMVRRGIDFADIARLPPGLVSHVELDDGSAVAAGDMFDETVNARRYCGEGEFDIAGFLRSLRGCDYAGAIGVEILSREQRALDPESAARRSHDTAAAAIAAAWKL